MTSDKVFMVVGAVAAVLLQVLVAPYIAVLAAVPNFVVAFAMALAIARPQQVSAVLPFAVGLTFDLVGGGPVGAMAFTLTALTAALSRLYAAASNDTLLMAIAFLALGILLADAVYGAFLLAFGYGASPIEALAYRIAPCFLYDFVIGVACYLVAMRFMQPATVTRTDITQLR